MPGWLVILYAISLPVAVWCEFRQRTESPFAGQAAAGFQRMSWLFNIYDRCVGLGIAVCAAPLILVACLLDAVSNHIGTDSCEAN